MTPARLFAVGCRIVHARSRVGTLTLTVERVETLAATAFAGERVRFTFTALSRTGTSFADSVTYGVDEQVELVGVAESERG